MLWLSCAVLSLPCSHCSLWCAKTFANSYSVTVKGQNSRILCLHLLRPLSSWCWAHARGIRELIISSLILRTVSKWEDVQYISGVVVWQINSLHNVKAAFHLSESRHKKCYELNEEAADQDDEMCQSSWAVMCLWMRHCTAHTMRGQQIPAGPPCDVWAHVPPGPSELNTHMEALGLRPAHASPLSSHNWANFTWLCPEVIQDHRVLILLLQSRAVEHFRCLFIPFSSHKVDFTLCCWPLCFLIVLAFNNLRWA